MSFLGFTIDLIQKMCSEDSEIKELFDQISAKHNETNEMEKQLEEFDREHVRLQIEQFELESINSQFDKDAMERSYQANMKAFEAAVNLRNLIEKIEFVKILQCHHMQMEEKSRKEWEPIKECIVRTAKWHEIMEQRHIVQEYRKAEAAHKESEDDYNKQKDSMKISFNESSNLIENATQKRNEMIVNLIQGSKELEKYGKEMELLKVYKEQINDLKNQKMDLTKQLDLSQHKAFNFNPIVPYKNQEVSNKSPDNLETYNFNMPKFPSFKDILSSFQTTPIVKPQSEITVIENTTNIFIKKSILRNSLENSMEFNHSITTKLTKQVSFKMPLEEYQEDSLTNDNIADATESDSSSNLSQQTTIEITEVNEEMEEIEDLKNETQLETIDLLTPLEKTNFEEPQQTEEMEVETENQDLNKSFEINKLEEDNQQTEEMVDDKENEIPNKPKIDIQECIIFKTPLPPVNKSTILKDKDNILSTFKASTIMSSDESPSSTEKTFSTTFYEEFLKASSSTTSHKSKFKSHSKRSTLKDFESYFNENRDVLFSSVSQETLQINKNQKMPTESIKNSEPDKTDQEEKVKQDILDFDNKEEFNFYSSDDNTAENLDLDFM